MAEDSTDRIFEILFNEDEITWQSIIYELVKTEEMDPWDVNVSVISKKYIRTLKKLQEFDVRISGKVVLAAAILLNIKSTRLLDEESKLDEIINPPEALEEDEDISYQSFSLNDVPSDKITLIPRTPQPRKRKISVFDLVEALQKALEVKRRRVLRDDVDVAEMPEIDRTVDVTKLILDLHKKIKQMVSDNDAVSFFELAGSERKEDQVSTLVPLLHLTNQRKINITQEKHFDDIQIKVNEK